MFPIIKNGSRCFFGTFNPETEIATPKGKKGVQSYNRITGFVALIFRKAYSLRDIEGKRWIINKSSTLSWIQRHETQIVDNTIHLKIADKLKNPTKENIQNVIKIICEAEHKIFETPTAEKIQQSNQFIEKMWADYKKGLNKVTFPLDQFVCAKSTDTGYTSTILSDSALANLPLKCENDPHALFIPSVLRPAKAEELNILINALQAAFITGKELAIVRLGTSFHSIMAVFSANGEFKLVDSMGSQVIDYQEIENKLNQAKILGKNGCPIAFKGEYINTHIQKGGNTCARMSTLYAYHTAKTKNMDAYQEVNGAFLEGRLHTFEDYSRIAGAKGTETVNKTPETYAKFMESWTYRSYGYRVDHWHRLPLADIANGKLIDSDYELFCMKLDPSAKLPNPCQYFPLEFGLDKGDGVFIHMQKIKDLDLEEVKFDSPPQTLGEVLSKDNSIRYLFYEKGNPQLKIVSLRAGEKFMLRQWDANNSIPSIIEA